MEQTRVCILGGSGFVGHHLATSLARAGIASRIPSRNPQRHRALKLVPNCEVVKSEGLGEAQLATLFDDCQAVINLVGILNETGGSRFQSAHVELAGRVVQACQARGVGRLLHMSALNADAEKGPSQYLKSKGEAEALVMAANGPDLGVTSFRPSVIFGIDDSFFNRFAGLLKLLPGPFLLACPNSRFAPVFVGDVAEAFRTSLQDKATIGQRYALCGPKSYSLIELVRYTGQQLGMDKPVIGLGQGLSGLQARLLGLLPGKPFSYDNYLSLQVDSVCEEDGLAQLGIAATPIDSVVPFYLANRAERRRYDQLRTKH